MNAFPYKTVEEAARGIGKYDTRNAPPSSKFCDRFANKFMEHFGIQGYQELIELYYNFDSITGSLDYNTKYKLENGLKILITGFTTYSEPYIKWPGLLFLYPKESKEIFFSKSLSEISRKGLEELYNRILPGNNFIINPYPGFENYDYELYKKYQLTKDDFDGRIEDGSLTYEDLFGMDMVASYVYSMEREIGYLIEKSGLFPKEDFLSRFNYYLSILDDLSLYYASSGIDFSKFYSLKKVAVDLEKLDWSIEPELVFYYECVNKKPEISGLIFKE
jgi:hypothetical protein